MSSQAAQPQAFKPLIQQVERLTQLLKDRSAVGYPAATMVQLVKVSTYREIAVAVFTIEGFGGGNNHSQYLALFDVDSEDRSQPFYTLVDVMHIGGKGWRAVESMDARVTSDSKSGDLSIELDALEVRPEDPPNFPGQKSVIRLVLRGERLHEACV